MNWVEREGEGWQVKQRDLCTRIDCLERRSLEMFVGPEERAGGETKL